MSFSAEIENFNKTISTDKTHVIHLPTIILVFGGEVGATLPPDHSCRNLFLTRAHEKNYAYASELKIPEMYPEWNQFEGYPNLVDFELDAACLCRSLVLFLESPGALAELGAFCTDAELRKIIFVIIQNNYYNADSFIRLGPIRKIEHEIDESICVIEDTSKKGFRNHVLDVLNALDSRLRKELKKERFDKEKRRDQFLLVADLIDLFAALKIGEIKDLTEKFGLTLSTNEIKKIIRLLILFELIEEAQINTDRFYVAKAANQTSYLDYDSADPGLKFDKIKFKLKIHGFLKSDNHRNRAYEKVRASK